MTTRLEYDETEFRIVVEQDGARVAAFRQPRTVGQRIHTIRGDVPLEDLDRTVLWRDEPRQFTVVEEFYLAGEFVRNDLHIILKEGSVVASAIAATIGG